MPHDERHERALYDDLKYPGHGYPERRQDLERPLSSWGRYAKDQGLGKKAVLAYSRTDNAGQPAACDLLRIEGSDLDAIPLQLTLCQPMAIPRELAGIIDIQNMTGEFSSFEIGDADYPGTGAPIEWPAFTAKIEWGVGGARTKAFVDFVNGVTVNLGPATFVRVSGIITPGRCRERKGTAGAYVLSAFVGPGRPRDGVAQKSVFLGAVTTAAPSDVWVVPPYAKGVTLVGLDVVAPNVTVGYITFCRSPDGTNPCGSYIINGNQPVPFPVPNGAQYFFVNNGMGTTQRFAAIFSLSI